MLEYFFVKIGQIELLLDSDTIWKNITEKQQEKQREQENFLQFSFTIDAICGLCV